MVLGWIGGHWRRHDRRLGRALGFYLIVSAVPVVVAGGVLYVMGHAVLRDPAVVAWATIGFGFLLYGADRIGLTVRRVEHMSLGHAFFIGLFQVLAPHSRRQPLGRHHDGGPLARLRAAGGGALLHAYVDPGHRGERCGGRLRGLEPRATPSSPRTQRWLQPCRSSWRSLQ